MIKTTVESTQFTPITLDLVTKSLLLGTVKVRAISQIKFKNLKSAAILAEMTVEKPQTLKSHNSERL